MNLKNQKRIAADLLKTGTNRVWFDKDRLDKIKEAITKADIRALINDKAIQAKPVKGVSRGRARKNILQKRKGRKQGPGSRKGKKTSRLPRKRKWILLIRAQREFISSLKEKGMINNETYRDVYLKAKGGFFRSRRHIHLYLTDRGLINEVKDTKKVNKK